VRRILWYPLTVRRILQNETYTGRTVYRRTRITVTRDPRTGKRKREVLTRPESEWVDVPGASPAIIERDVWEKAQAVFLDPPHRARLGHALYPYPLSGHVRCDGCQGSLSGSTLSGGTGRHRTRYYGCRNRSLADRAARCGSRYVRAEPLEQRLVNSLRSVIADPQQIISAFNYLHASVQLPDQRAIEQAQQRLATAEQQIRRLARLARLAEDDDAADALGDELKEAARAKRAAERQIERLLAEQRPVPHITTDPASLAELSERVAAWLDPTDPEKMRLVLEGLEITVWAGVGEPKATGSLPVNATCEQNSHADVCAVVTKFRRRECLGTSCCQC